MYSDDREKWGVHLGHSMMEEGLEVAMKHPLAQLHAQFFAAALAEIRRTSTWTSRDIVNLAFEVADDAIAEYRKRFYEDEIPVWGDTGLREVKPDPRGAFPCADGHAFDDKGICVTCGINAAISREKPR